MLTWWSMYLEAGVSRRPICFGEGSRRESRAYMDAGLRTGDPDSPTMLRGKPFNRVSSRARNNRGRARRTR